MDSSRIWFLFNIGLETKSRRRSCTSGPRCFFHGPQSERIVGVCLTGRLKARKEVAGWRVPATFGTNSNHKAISDRVLDDLRTIFNVELFQDPSAIGADRFCAE